MGRAPCCEKMGLKKGPWTPEEDRILICFIQKYGHENWRALPKQAGLLRCGKSCRLRWMNYLKPDIKRGNFTKEEEETIIKLHEILGNRWSVIAGRLPGRTDNEIKNVWHTHLKKRLKDYQATNPKSKARKIMETKIGSNIENKSEPTNSNPSVVQSPEYNDEPFSPQSSFSDMSSTVTDQSTTPFTSCETNNDNNNNKIETEFEKCVGDSENFDGEIDESFWFDSLSTDDHQRDSHLTVVASDFAVTDTNELQQGFEFGSVDHQNGYEDYVKNIDDGMEFWYDIFITTGGEQELAQF